MADRVTLLGFVMEADAERVAAEMRGIAGATLLTVAAEGVVAIAERGNGRPTRRKTDLRHLAVRQRRLETACQIAAFLPADPAAPPCDGAELGPLLVRHAVNLRAAIAEDGGRHQWDVVVRWPGEGVVAAARDRLSGAACHGQAELAASIGRVLDEERALRQARLTEAMAAASIAVAEGPATSETEARVTALVPARGEARLEAALDALGAPFGAGDRVDLIGPMPPVSFAAWRLERTEAAAIAAAWDRLDLPEHIDAAGLTRRWRASAMRLHPDLSGRAEPEGFHEARSAHHLVADLCREIGGEMWRLGDLTGRAGWRLRPPPPLRQTAAKHMP